MDRRVRAAFSQQHLLNLGHLHADLGLGDDIVVCVGEDPASGKQGPSEDMLGFLSQAFSWPELQRYRTDSLALLIIASLRLQTEVWFSLNDMLCGYC